MKEEEKKIEEEFLKKMPELKMNHEITWNEKGIGENLRSLCRLLERNAISLNKLCIGSHER